MGGFKFEMDDRAIKKMADDAVKSLVKEAQTAFDRLHRLYAGKPVGEVLPQVRSEFRRLEWKASESEIRDYAQLIADGKKVVIRT